MQSILAPGWDLDFRPHLMQNQALAAFFLRVLSAK